MPRNRRPPGTPHPVRPWGDLGAFVAGLIEVVEADPATRDVAGFLTRNGMRPEGTINGVLTIESPFGTLTMVLPPDAPPILRLTRAFHEDLGARPDLPPMAAQSILNQEFERARAALRQTLGPDRRTGVYDSLHGDATFHWSRWHGEGSTTYLVQDDRSGPGTRDLSIWSLPVPGLTEEPPMRRILSRFTR